MKKPQFEWPFLVEDGIARLHNSYAEDYISLILSGVNKRG